MNALSTQSSSNAPSSSSLRTALGDSTRGAVERRDYTIQRGDTLGQLAQRFGTEIGTLARLNGIANPNRIIAGATITVPAEGQRTHVVARGETLGAIARGAGLSLAEVLAANPQIRNPDRIYPGDSIALPAPGPERVNAGKQGVAMERVAPVEATRLTGGTLRLTETDILNIKKTLQTEWVQSAGTAQAHGIIDTILNRVASGRWGNTVADVVNARNQFSDINGPVSRRDGRNSVEQLPAARIGERVDQLVDSYLAERAGGRASSIGSHLNYANPNYSDARNLGWINALDGPVLGRGDAIHRHGTTPDLERFRPEPFAIALPGDRQRSPRPGPVDGRAVAAAAGVAIKNSQVDIASLDPAMAPVIRAVAAAAQSLGLPQPVITSGNDSRHSNGSLHYQNRALDFRGNNISDAQGIALQNEVRRILGPGYDVIFETFASNPANDHLHVEYDPR
jgi:LysM repeat protein